MAFNLITDFTGEFNISQSKFGESDLENVITITEEEILKQLLGEDLHAKFIAGLAVTPTPDVIWTDLRDGKTYTVVNKDGVTVNVIYQGIKKMLRYFCYCEMLKFQSSQNTEVGEVDPQQQNSTRKANSQLAVQIEKAYNKGIALYGFDIENYGNAYNNNLITRQNLDYYNCHCDCNNSNPKYKYDYYAELVKGSCFNYLYKYKDNYPTWQFNVKDLMLLGGWL